MKIYTRHGNRYVIDHNMHMITGENKNINPIYYYGEAMGNTIGKSYYTM